MLRVLQVIGKIDELCRLVTEPRYCLNIVRKILGAPGIQCRDTWGCGVGQLAIYGRPRDFAMHKCRARYLARALLSRGAVLRGANESIEK